MRYSYLELSSKVKLIIYKLKYLIKNIILNHNVNLILGNNVKIDKYVWFRFGTNSNIFIGDNVYFGRGCRIECQPGATLSIGKNVIITGYCFVSSCSSIKIGANSQIGEFVSIRDNEHNYRDVKKSLDMQRCEITPIIVSDDVWIGRGCAILKGVSIGEHSVIGANSVVNRNIPQYSVAVGSPARVKKIYDFETQKWKKV